MLPAFAGHAACARTCSCSRPSSRTWVRWSASSSTRRTRAARMQAFRAAFERIAQLDATLSDYRADSEVNRVCRSAVGKPVKVSADLFTVLAAARALAEETGGAFDVTLGPVTLLWRQARREHRLPEPGALREALQHSGYRKLHLDPAARTVTLDQEGCASISEASARAMPPTRRWLPWRNSASAARWWRPAAILPSAIRRPDARAGASASMRPTAMRKASRACWNSATRLFPLPAIPTQNLEAGGVQVFAHRRSGNRDGTHAADHGYRGGAPWNRCRFLVHRPERSRPGTRHGADRKACRAGGALHHRSRGAVQVRSRPVGRVSQCDAAHGGVETAVSHADRIRPPAPPHLYK